MTLASGDLTTLANAKVYLASDPSDQVLSGLITRVSRMIQSTLNRTILIPKAYNEQFNGSGTNQLVLPHWPLLSILSLKVSGQTLSLAPQLDQQSLLGSPYGYRFQTPEDSPPGNPAVIELTGGAFYYPGRQNVVISYMAGYQVTGEAQIIPAVTAQITPTAPYGIWATDQGVTFSDGTVLTAVANAPGAGQYVPPTPDAANPVLYYLFAAADVGKTVLLTYGFIPGDVEQVALEVVAERASVRSRVGIRSQSLGGQESTSYDMDAMNKYVLRSLQPYVSVLPPAIGASV
jgi:hypothetical protein